MTNFSLSIATAAASLLVSTITAQAPTRPNIVWLVAEDMSPWLPCYGDTTVPTPNLDRLAEQSVRYRAAFATSPVCAAARSTLITGMHALRMGTMHHRTGQPAPGVISKNPDAYASIPNYEGVPPEFVRCFPEQLRADGYYCSNNAKRDYQFRAPATVWDASGNKAHWRNRPDEVPFFAVFNFGGTHESQAFPNAKRRPAVVSPENVPVPPIYPDTPAVRDALARTYNNIATLDGWVGKFVRQLEEDKLLDSTYVFFYSDHGVGLPRGKRSPYDLGTRVPLLIRHPGGDDGGTTENRVVTFADFGPTVLSLAGIAPDRRLDGMAFLGPHEEMPARTHAFCHSDRFDEGYDCARSVTDGRYRLVRNLDRGIPHLIDNDYRNNLPMMKDLIERRGTASPASIWQTVSTSRPSEELYDSANDPWELNNRVDDVQLATVRDRLRTQLDEWLESLGTDLGTIRPEREMVHTHLWHGTSKPKTSPPTMHLDNELVVIECDTPGASVGYRLRRKGPWTVYRRPFPRAELGRAAEVRVLAHRIGFEPATVRVNLDGE